MGFHEPPIPVGQGPSGFDIGRSLVVKCQKSRDSLFGELIHEKMFLPQTFHQSSSVAHGPAKLLALYLHLGTVLYRNHLIPDRQESAAHEIPNHCIFPLVFYALFSHRYYARFGKSDSRINQTVEEKQYSICDSSQQNRQTLSMANTSRNG